HRPVLEIREKVLPNRRSGEMRLLTVIGLLGVIVGLCAPSAQGSNITFSYGAGDGCSDSVTGSGPVSYGNLQNPVTCTGATLGAVTNVAAEASLTTLKLYLDSAGTGPINAPGRSA